MKNEEEYNLTLSDYIPPKLRALKPLKPMKPKAVAAPLSKSRHPYLLLTPPPQRC